MTRTRKHKPTPARSLRVEQRGSWLGLVAVFLLKLLFHPVRLAVLAVVLLALALRPTWERYLPNLNEEPAFLVAADNIQITPASQPVPNNFVERVLAAGKFESEMSLLDGSLLPRLSDAFADNPWVKRVVLLRKESPGRIRIQLEYRRVAAIIETSVGDVPIAEDGVLLPPADLTVADSEQYPRIIGVTPTPAMPVGTQWDDGVVMGATRIAAILAPAWKALDIAAIRVPREDAGTTRSVYELQTVGGSRVIWGSAPGAGLVDEPTAQQKLTRLQAYIASRGPLNASSPPLEIDLRPWQGVVSRPLAVVGDAALTSR